MLLLRIFGASCLLVSVLALVYDGTKTLGSDGELVITAFGKHWFDIHRESLNMTQAAIERHVAPWLWDPVLTTVLQAPTWLVFGVVGLLFYILGRRRKTVDVFAN